MKKRPPKETDQEVIERAFILLKNCMTDHPEIEPTLWAGAFWSVLVDGYIKSGRSYEQFIQETKLISSHYKSWWDGDNC